MALEDILKKIKEDARGKAKIIKKEAESGADLFLAKARKEAHSLEESILHEARDSIQSEERRVLTLANLAARKEILAKKQDLIAEVFKKAQASLLKLPDKEYRAALEVLLLRTAESGEEEVIISTSEKHLDASFLAGINKKLRAEGKQGKLKIAPQKKDFLGGFILRSGRKEINSTFSALFKERREELETQVAGILFKEAD